MATPLSHLFHFIYCPECHIYLCSDAPPALHPPSSSSTESKPFQWPASVPHILCSHRVDGACGCSASRWIGLCHLVVSQLSCCTIPYLSHSCKEAVNWSSNIQTEATRTDKWMHRHMVALNWTILIPMVWHHKCSLHAHTIRAQACHILLPLHILALIALRTV